MLVVRNPASSCAIRPFGPGNPEVPEVRQKNTHDLEEATRVNTVDAGEVTVFVGENEKREHWCLTAKEALLPVSSKMNFAIIALKFSIYS